MVMRSYTYRHRVSSTLYSKPSGGAGTTVQSNVSYHSGTNFVEHDGPVPNWKARIRAGQDATSNLNGQRYMMTRVDGGIFQRRRHSSIGEQYYERTGDLVDPQTPALPASLSLTEANNAAITEFVSKASRYQTQFQSGIFLGELAKTLRSIRSPAKVLRSRVDDYLATLRRRRKGPKHVRERVLQNTWLEYQYGWRPLFKDIDDGLKALAEDRSIRRVVRPIRAIASRRTNASAVTNQLSHGSCEWKVQVNSWSEATVLLVGGVYSQVDNPIVRERKAWGVTLDQFLPTVWELIPYSFLVDYFLNVGEVLSAWSFQSSNIAWCCRTEIRENVETRFSKDFKFGETDNVHTWFDLGKGGSPSSSEARVRIVNRSRNQQALIPTLGFRVPGFRSDSEKWLNIAALATKHKRLIPF